eukprot:CAMPEP_0185024004 /NCGR_PEP_ID=MMETSP1103-20130426/6882_1 /TAXON_ID=36769 /ORGANISM="Paraphysomonas bandaiensis, Strain Caron Lab Isolate" /LENGTH=165 /DNA_ID=CAMNT_0027556835 /DNA_START=143 /DNA_END=640 /DNA_ORIENTATION=-
MDDFGNERKRQRRNAIRPNSIEAMAIREIAEEYTNRSAVEAVQSLSIDSSEIRLAQASASSGDGGSPQSAAASSASHVSSLFPLVADSTPVVAEVSLCDDNSSEVSDNQSPVLASASPVEIRVIPVLSSEDDDDQTAVVGTIVHDSMEPIAPPLPTPSGSSFSPQ